MVIWIVVGLLGVALLVWAFWPRRRGIADEQLRKAGWRQEGRGSYRGG